MTILFYRSSVLSNCIRRSFPGVGSPDNIRTVTQIPKCFESGLQLHSVFSNAATRFANQIAGGYIFLYVLLNKITRRKEELIRSTVTQPLNGTRGLVDGTMSLCEDAGGSQPGVASPIWIGSGVVVAGSNRAEARKTRITVPP